MPRVPLRFEMRTSDALVTSLMYCHPPTHGLPSPYPCTPTQLMLFSGGDDTEVKMWDLVDKTCTATFKV